MSWPAIDSHGRRGTFVWASDHTYSRIRFRAAQQLLQAQRKEPGRQQNCHGSQGASGAHAHPAAHQQCPTGPLQAAWKGSHPETPPELRFIDRQEHSAHAGPTRPGIAVRIALPCGPRCRTRYPAHERAFSLGRFQGLLLATVATVASRPARQPEKDPVCLPTRLPGGASR